MQRTKIQNIHYPVPVDLIKTCAVKTLREKNICYQEKECRLQQYQVNQIKYQIEIRNNKPNSINPSIPFLATLCRSRSSYLARDPWQPLILAGDPWHPLFLAGDPWHPLFLAGDLWHPLFLARDLTNAVSSRRAAAAVHVGVQPMVS